MYVVQIRLDLASTRMLALFATNYSCTSDSPLTLLSDGKRGVVTTISSAIGCSVIIYCNCDTNVAMSPSPEWSSFAPTPPDLQYDEVVL